MNEEQRKEEIKEKETKKKGWWSQVPTKTKIVTGIIILIIMYFLRNTGWKMNETWWILGILAAIIYFAGTTQKAEKDYYTTEDAMVLLEEHIEWQKRKEKIDNNTKITVGPRAQLLKTKATGKEYIIEIQIHDTDGTVEYAMGIVNYNVPGNPRMIACDWRMRGDEKPHIKTVEPDFLRYSKRYGSAFQKLFGGP